MADALPEPLFTPASKAPAGQHDENVDFDAIVKAVGREYAESIRRITLALYVFAAAHARSRNIIIADTKFEFGTDKAGNLILIDEVLTPDSSRFWPMASYKPGISPPSFDKQFVRDYLESLHWNKNAAGTAPSAGYHRAHQRELSQRARAVDGLTSAACPRRWNACRRDSSKDRGACRLPGGRCCGRSAIRSPSAGIGWPARSASRP